MKSALTDSDKRQKVIKKRNAVARAWYPDAVKLEALKLWLISGNLKTVGASLGIPYPTLQVWRYSDWWSQLAEEIRTEGQMQLSNKLKTIAERAMDETLDRLEKGDWVLNQKTGKMERKPVAMRDAHRVAESFTDRHIRLDAKPQEAINNQKIQDRLQNLAIAFEQFAKKTKKIEVVDAVQIESTGEMDVFAEAKNGEEMGQGDTFDQIPSQEKEVNDLSGQA